MKRSAILAIVTGLLWVDASAVLGSIYRISSVTDLTPNGPLATSPAKARYVTSVGTGSSFEIWYEERMQNKLYYATGSYSGSDVTLTGFAEVTLTGDYGPPNYSPPNYKHPEVIKVGATYHMISYEDYFTGSSGTLLDFQGKVGYTPATRGKPAYGVSAFCEDGGTYVLIQDTLDGYHFPATTTNPGGLTWTQHGYGTPPTLGHPDGIYQLTQAPPNHDYRLTPSGDLVKIGGNWLYFVPDEADGGLGLVDLGTDVTQSIPDQDWVYDPDGDATGYMGPILGVSTNPGLGGPNSRTEFKEATLLPTGNEGEYLVLYTAEWGGGDSQIGAAVITVFAVPEPATVALLGCGAFGVLLRRRRR